MTMAFTGVEVQQSWPPSDPTERYSEWTQPTSPWTYDNDGPNPVLEPSNSQMRSRKRGTATTGVSAVPPYHPDYEPAQGEGDDDDDNDGYYHHDDGDYDDGGERFAEYEYEQTKGAHARVRRGSEGYEVRTIDREQLLAEFIQSRAQEEGHYRRYVPEPPSESESENSGGDGEEDFVVEEEGIEDEGNDEDEDEEDDEPLAVRVEKWRSGEAIS